jgi:hypothetical protein
MPAVLPVGAAELGSETGLWRVLSHRSLEASVPVSEAESFAYWPIVWPAAGPSLMPML